MLPLSSTMSSPARRRRHRAHKNGKATERFPNPRASKSRSDHRSRPAVASFPTRGCPSGMAPRPKIRPRKADIPSMLFRVVWTSALIAVVSAFGETTYGGCTIPSQWHGRWYEAHDGDVIISSTEVGKKGRCLQNGGNYFLFDNREIDCLTCLLVIQKHNNLIQYRESVCMGRSSFDSICSTIQSETIQRTLIRAPHERAERCPLNVTYHFSYNNNSGGFCREPLSTMSACSSPSVLLFSFEQCQGVAYSFSRRIKMECLAVWHEGGQSFMVGRFFQHHHHHHHHHEHHLHQEYHHHHHHHHHQHHQQQPQQQHDQYRCFMFRIFGTLAHAAMSADASCRGLRSHRDGPTVFEFSAVPSEPPRWPETECVFPRWLWSSKWRDFSNQQLLEADTSGQLLSVQSPETSAEVSLLFRCRRQTNTRESSSTSFRALVSVVNVCKLQYQCLQFVRKNLDVIEMHMGVATADEATNDCFKSTSSFNSKLLLIRSPLPSSRDDCIEKGQYRIYTGVLSCHSYLRSGCSMNHDIDIISSCSSKPGLQLKCLSTWDVENRRYIIAATLGDRKSNVLNCYVFYQKDDVILFSYDPHCQDGVFASSSEKFTYVMELFSVPCKPTEGPPSMMVFETQKNSSPLVSYSVFQYRGNDLRALKQIVTTGTASNSVEFGHPAMSIAPFFLSVMADAVSRSSS